MSSLATKLVDFGLSEKESKIYSIILENGSVPISIIEVLSGLSSGEINDVVENLIRKELVLRVDERVVPLPPIGLVSNYLYRFLKEYRGVIDKLQSKLSDMESRLRGIADLDLTKYVNIGVFISQVEDLRKVISDILSEFVSKVDSIESIVNQFIDLLSKTTFGFDSVADSLSMLRNEAGKPFISKETLKDSFKKALETEMHTLRSLVEKLSESLKNIRDTISEFRERIFSRFATTLEALGELHSTIVSFKDNIFDTFIPKVKENVQKATESVLGAIRTVKEDLSAKLSELEENLNYLVEAIKKDVGEGYDSVIDRFGKDLKGFVDGFYEDYKSVLEVINKDLEESITRFNAVSEDIKKNLNIVFEKNEKQLEAFPVALEKAINESTKVITTEFLRIYEENITELTELENETWVWLSKKILEAADLLIETSDRLRTLHSGLLDQISRRLDILREYILSLPTKLYSSMDREWRNFLTESTKRFTNLFNLTKKEVERTAKTTLSELSVLMRDILDAHKKSDAIFKESVKQILNNSIKKTHSHLSNALETLIKIRENLNSKPNMEGLIEELDFAIETLKRISEEEIPMELKQGMEYIDSSYEVKEKGYEEILNRFDKTIQSRINQLITNTLDLLTKTEKGYMKDLELLMESIKLIYGNQVEALNALISDSLTSIMNSFKETETKLENILTTHSDTMVKIFRESTSEIKERIDEFLTEFKAKLEELPKKYEAGIAKLAENTKTVLRSIADKTIELMREINKTLVDELSKSQSEIKEIEDSLDKTQKYHEEKLEEVKKEIDALYDELFKGGIKLVNEYLETLLSDLKKNLETIQSKYRKIYEILFEKLNEKVEEALYRGFQEAQISLESRFNEITSNFRDELDNLTKTIESVRNAFKVVNEADILAESKSIIEELESKNSDATMVIENISSKLTDLVYEEVTKDIERIIKERLDNISHLFNETRTMYNELREKADGLFETVKVLKGLLEEGKLEKLTELIDKLNREIIDSLKIINTKVNDVLKTLRDGLAFTKSMNKADLERIFSEINKIYITFISLRDEIKRMSLTLFEKISVIKHDKAVKEVIRSALEKDADKLVVYLGYIDSDIIDVLRRRRIPNLFVKARIDIITEVEELLNVKRIRKGNIYNVAVIVKDSKEAYIVKRSRGMRELIYVYDIDLVKTLETAFF